MTLLPISFRQSRKNSTLKALLFLLPTFVFVGMFNYYPMFNALFHGFFRWNGYSPGQFTGLENYSALFHDPAFLVSVRNSLITIVVLVCINIVFPLLAGELLIHLNRVRIQYAFRVLFVVPMVVPGMVILLVWQFLYQPSLGINNLFMLLGLDNLAKNWLGDPALALGSILFIGFPWISGLPFLLFLSALQQIPQSLFDAASIDGAAGLKRVFLIDIPSIGSTIRVVSMLAVIGAVQMFNNVWVMTQGGPANASMVPGVLLYQNAFYYGRFGYACAIGSFIFIVTMILTIINSRIGKES